MDLSKFQLERVFYFIAGVIPGFIALVIFQMGHRGLLERFLDLEFLGYKTKISIVLLVAFVIGNSLTVFLSAVLGAIGGAVGAAIANRPAPDRSSLQSAPWRDTRWRMMAREKLGPKTPDDTRIMSPAMFDLRKRMVEALPEAQRGAAVFELTSERDKAVLDDMVWEQWYDQYHRLVLNPDERSMEWYVRRGLNFNLQTSAVYVLVSAVFVSGLRHWWWMVPSCVWVLLLVAESYHESQQYLDKWSTLFDQIKHLASLPKPD